MDEKLTQLVLGKVVDCLVILPNLCQILLVEHRLVFAGVGRIGIAHARCLVYDPRKVHTSLLRIAKQVDFLLDCNCRCVLTAAHFV